ncbi:MAG TPA: SGNH/GDSL hydrolase family protein [Alphaproteobacteria bacterium]|nr:SGNH/GDSL hydrolase family protein [Alphaproteobacteria bacterium]
MRRLLRVAAFALGASMGSADAAAPIRVVAFGTSLTAHGHWPGEVARRLEACASIDIVIVAQAGANSDWGVAVLPRVVASNPAIVLIEFAVNDASLLHGLSIARSRANTLAILGAIAAAGAQPVLMTMNPAHGWRFLSRPWLGSYYGLYRDIAAERGVPLIDLTPVWEARADLASAIPDGIHPTPEAARETIAPAVAEALRPLLCP